MKMKIGLISRGRTCSSIIINSLAKRYNLPNKYELYMDAARKLNNDYFARKNGDIHRNQRFRNKIEQITNQLFLENDFICKIWPSMFVTPSHKISLDTSFNDFKERILFDISSYTNITKYDQLYFLDRDLHKSTTSWIYSKKTRIFTKSHRPPKIYIEKIDYDIVRFYILEFCLHQKIKSFLQNQNIPYIDITDINLYIDTAITAPKKSERDYETLIENYSELQKFITDWYPICLENTKDWHYT